MEWTARMTKEPRSGNRGKNITVKYWRNQARTQRRLGRVFPELAWQANDVAKEYHDAIRRQKKVHWDDFLADGTNIWQPARYSERRQGDSGCNCGIDSVHRILYYYDSFSRLCLLFGR